MIDTALNFSLYLIEAVIKFALYILECVAVTGLLAIVVAGAVSAYVYFKEM